MYEVMYKNGWRTEEVRFFNPERYLILEGETLVTSAPPNPDPAVVYIPSVVTVPAPPAPAPTGNDCQMWATNGSTMSWVGPSNGTMDICQVGTWLDWIRSSGHTTIFSVTVPGTMQITVGSYSTTVAGNMTTYTVINSSGPSGGFRWTPQQGYGWRR
jgi:hypothetical protein